MEKMNRKGTDMSEIVTFIGALVLTIIIGGFLVFIIGVIVDAKTDVFYKDMSVSESSYTTRILLETRLDDDYKFYEYLIDVVNSDNFDGFKETSEKVLKEYYGDEITDPWVISLNNKKWALGPAPNGEVYIQDIPPTIIPNPSGDNIELLIKPVRPIDFKGITRLKYTPVSSNKDLYSPTGVELEELTDIPRVNCYEDDTSVGKICKADVEIVRKLREISSNLTENKQTLLITQAYRDWQIQYNLWIKNNKNSTLACDPGTQTNPNMGCTHMTGRAIDVNLFDVNGNKLSVEQVETLLCPYGFIRYAKEDWHFEYGTDRYARGHSAGVCRI